MAVDNGTELFGKYRLLTKIGSGGMAEIFKASLVGVDGFEKILVVKKILPRYARHRQFITMFVQEAKVCSSLQHANVVQIYELGEVDGDYFIAMELVNGCDLLQVLTRATQEGSPIPPEHCLYVVGEICKGIGYAHTATNARGQPLNIVHLDVSPSNILLGFEGEVKLTDFGVAKATVEGRSAAADDRLKGKLGYMSPEQVTGKKIDHRSDIFSIGIILYELFTLKRLFLGRTDIETLANIRDADIEPRLQRHPEIPDEVQDILRRALKPNPDTRFQTAHELEDAISQYLFDKRIRVTPQIFGAFLRGLAGVAGPAPAEAPKEISGIRTGRVADETLAPGTRSRRPATPVKIVHSRPPVADDTTFHFRSGDGDVFGPVTYNNLRNLLRTHSVSADELVSIDGEEWRPLREVPELFDVVPESLRQEPVAPTDTGPFGLADAARRIVRMVSGKWTGRLKLSRGGRLKEIWFRRGRPVHISSNRKSELFGAMLLERNVLTEEQLAQGFAHVRQNPQPLGSAIVTLGFLDQAALFQELDHQFREKFIECFGWRDATYEYYSLQEPPSSVVPFSLDPYPAIAEGIRRHVGPDVLAEHFEKLEDKMVRLVSDPLFDGARLKLAPREHRVRVALEARPKKVRALLDLLGPEMHETVLLVLYLLQQTEQILIG